MPAIHALLDPDRQPAGQPQGGAGEFGVHPAQLGARGTHRCGSGRKRIRIITYPS